MSTSPSSGVMSGPDVLEVISNLSSDEVFTPPAVVNDMLELLPDEVWANPDFRWLDLGCKTGVFLREITRRLMVGLVDSFPSEDERLDHILKNMVFGVAITEITSLMARRTLYCSKDASSTQSLVAMSSPNGNVWFERIEHDFGDSGRCRECNASQSQFGDGEVENYAYGFIHSEGRKRIEGALGMNFDVIVGNPPYQMDAEGGNRTIPLYNLFLDEAKKLNPKYISLVIPSRWMTSGLGLGDFRSEMLSDQRIRKLVTFSRMDSVFPGVDFEGGVCYFLWDRDYQGQCDTSFVQDDVIVGPIARDLDEFDIFLRDARAIPILRKVLALNEPSITNILAADKEFGMTSNFSGFSKDEKAGTIPLYYNDKGKRLRGWMARAAVPKSQHLIDTWKVLIPQAYGERGAIPAQVLGPMQVVSSPSACTQTYLFLFLDDEDSAANAEAYLRTRFVRFLISLRKTTQHATRSTYTWVPKQPWNEVWTDEKLFKKYGFTDEEQAYVEAMIREMP